MTRRIIISVFFTLSLLRCLGQTDSLKSSWHNAIRLGIGVEKLPYLEVGLSRITFADKGPNSGTAGFYAAGQLGVRNEEVFYGGKVGYETAWMIGMWAIEAKYLTDNHQSKFYVTPKVGLSLFGTCNLLYGYNLPTGESNSIDIGRHQVSVTFNFSKKLRKDMGW